MIEIRHLKKAFGSNVVLKDFNCTINEGDVIAVIGPSGCGKTTLIRCLNLLEAATSGEIIFDGKDILKGEMNLNEARKYAGMVFQGYNLYPHFTVLENIMVPQVDILGRSKQEAYDRAVEHLKMVDLFHTAAKYPHQLSGGQQQRVAIARTLAMDNKVIMFDEPTSALDPIMTREVQYVIKNLSKSGRTMIIVTHDMRLAREVANRVFFITEGILYEEGATEQIFQNPQKEKTWKFVNCVNEKNIHITKKDFVFIEYMTEINKFAERNSFPDYIYKALISIFEELVAITLIPAIGPEDTIDIQLSYSEIISRVNMKIELTGINTDPLDNADEICKNILKHYADEISFKPENEDKASISIVLKSPESN